VPLVAVSIKLDRIDETLLYQDKGGWWLARWHARGGRQRENGRRAEWPKERYAAGEKGPAWALARNRRRQSCVERRP
jgi:hypothetical protein